MLLQQPAQSPYDLRFNLFGFPVRIAWSFWVASVVFGFELVRSIEIIFGPDSPGRLPLLVLWAICLLVSILIHELGHAFAMRQHGTESSIVLYHFGGLAIPRASSRSGQGRHGGYLSDIWISFAGPLAQLLSAIILIAAIHFAGYSMSVLSDSFIGFEHVPGIATGTPIDSPGINAMLIFYLFPSIFWALVNLVPVLPMDGGQIAKSFVMMRGGDLSQALWVSVIAAGLVAAWGMSIGQSYLAIFFLILGVTSFQAIQQVGKGWQ